MPLNKNKQNNLKTALFFLERGYKNKPELKEGGENEMIIKWIERTPTEILEKIDSKVVDERLLRRLAEQVFSFTKQYPKLMQEFKEKYFN